MVNSQIEQDLDTRRVRLEDDSAGELEVAKLNNGSLAAGQSDARRIQGHDEVGRCRKQGLALEAVVLDPRKLVELEHVAPPQLMLVVIAGPNTEEFVGLIELEVVLARDARFPV